MNSVGSQVQIFSRETDSDEERVPVFKAREKMPVLPSAAELEFDKWTPEQRSAWGFHLKSIHTLDRKSAWEALGDGFVISNNYAHRCAPSHKFGGHLYPEKGLGRIYVLIGSVLDAMMPVINRCGWKTSRYLLFGEGNEHDAHMKLFMVVLLNLNDQCTALLDYVNTLDDKGVRYGARMRSREPPLLAVIEETKMCVAELVTIPPLRMPEQECQSSSSGDDKPTSV